ncbi:MAG: amidohydrolase family protein, partial [Dehalococcoidia bacterium]|nr:amidohydrolase family protein [Dehalococcoidia bacterium]
MNLQAADLVLYNANVLTLDPERPVAELVAVGDGEIIAVGINDDLETFKGQARLIDCEGKTVVPGFNDAHAHIFACVSNLLSIDCSPGSVKSISEIQGKIKREAGLVPRGAWLRASGYNEFYLAE